MSALRINFDHSLGFVLNDISRLTRKEFDRRVRRFALTRAQWLFLFHAARQHLRPKAEHMVRKLAGVAEELRSEYLQAVPPDRRATLMDDLLLIKLRLQQMAAEGKKSSS